MNKLGKRIYTLLKFALKTSGTYNPEEIMPYVEEDLTIPEAKEIEAFLKWCHENGKTFGWANYEDVFREFKDGNKKD